MPKTAAKVKGCYHCSQRRIDCDRTEPSCLKCLKKGLECTGLGLRYRFNPGVAARGRYKGKELPCEHDAVAPPRAGELPPVTWIESEKESSARPKRAKRRQKSATTSTLTFDPNPSSTDSDGEESTINSGRSSPILTSSSRDLVAQRPTVDNQLVLATGKASIGNKARFWTQQCRPRGLETHDHVTRMLFANFSETVARTMVVFDDQSNNYRKLILPLAAAHDLVRNAVFAASAHQLASKMPGLAKEAMKYQMTAVNSLTQYPDAVRSEPTAVLAAVTLLLVNETVSGGFDQFQVLYKMMKYCMEIEDGSSVSRPSALTSFLREQVGMIDFFMQPFLGEETAVWNISSKFLGPLKFLTDAALRHPSHADTVQALEKAFLQASEIYLQRTMHNVARDATIPIVEKLKGVVEQIPSNSPGEHTLVWVYFIGAAESSTTSHREFFQDRLKQLYVKTGFSNILCSLRMLDEVWANSDTRWTRLIMEIDQAFIM